MIQVKIFQDTCWYCHRLKTSYAPCLNPLVTTRISTQIHLLAKCIFIATYSIAKPTRYWGQTSTKLQMRLIFVANVVVVIYSSTKINLATCTMHMYLEVKRKALNHIWKCWCSLPLQQFISGHPSGSRRSLKGSKRNVKGQIVQVKFRFSSSTVRQTHT